MPVPPVVMIACTSGVGELTDDGVPHELRIVFDNGAAGDAMAGGDEQLRDGASARVGGLGARIADGDDEAAAPIAAPALCVPRRRHSGHCTRRVLPSRHAAPGPRNAGTGCVPVRVRACRGGFAASLRCARGRRAVAIRSSSIETRPVGGRHAPEADARREDRPADRPVVRIRLREHGQRHVRRARAPGQGISTLAAFTCSARHSPRRRFS